MDKKLVDAMLQQINKEMYSSYLYLSMSSWASHDGWKGFANWLMVQSKEELTHAKLFYDLLVDRGEHCILQPIAGPPSSWKSLQEAMEETYEHEKFITKSINNIADIALEVKDHASYEFILKLVKEQIEEEANANDLIVRLRRMAEHPAMLESLDKEMATRVFIPPQVQ